MLDNIWNADLTKSIYLEDDKKKREKKQKGCKVSL